MSELTAAGLFPPPGDDLRLGGPVFLSAFIHAAIIVLLISLASRMALKPVDPIRVMEINVMGKQDLALKGEANDFTAGPLPEEAPLAQPARDAQPAARGNTRKLSKAIAQAAPAEPPPLPSLSAKRPLFTATDSQAPASLGREKIYVSAQTKFRPEPAVAEKSAAGEGLVGVSGAAIDLAAKRGAGGPPAGRSDFLASGRGSAAGGNSLSRRGEPVIFQSSRLSDDPVLASAKPAKLDAPSDDFFTINGPLKNRKILKLSLPKYPRWAEQRGLEARVAVRITVNPRGKVKPGILLEQTSGFPELDTLVRDAAAKMVFAPLTSGEGDQWGILTFNFNLKRGGA